MTKKNKEFQEDRRKQLDKPEKTKSLEELADVFIKPSKKPDYTAALARAYSMCHFHYTDCM